MGNYIDDKGQEISSEEKQDDLKNEALERQYREYMDISEDEYIKSIYPKEHEEYLVDGAHLSCTSIVSHPQDLKGRTYLKGIPNTISILKVTENPKMESCGLHHATILDSQINKNIFPFHCNCKNPLDNEEEWRKLLSDNSCAEKGTCRALMKLNPYWENIPTGAPYLSFNDDIKGKLPGINMTSILFCRHGGLIYPTTSGQVMDRLIIILSKDRNSLSDEELKELGYLFQNGDATDRNRIFDYLFPILLLTGNSYGEAELERHIKYLNTSNDKVPHAASRYIQALNTLGINYNNYSVQDMITLLSWDQNKINKTYEKCREYSIKSGILISPKLALAIIGAEGTGSYDTNAKVASCYNNGNGPQHDFDIDTELALELIKNKMTGFIFYMEEYKAASINVGVTNGLLITYLCQENPILGKNCTGVYAENDYWIDVVMEKYQKYSSNIKAETRDYLKDYETFFEGYEKGLIVNNDTVQYKFAIEGGKVVAKVK